MIEPVETIQADASRAIREFEAPSFFSVACGIVSPLDGDQVNAALAAVGKPVLSPERAKAAAEQFLLEIPGAVSSDICDCPAHIARVRRDSESYVAAVRELADPALLADRLVSEASTKDHWSDQAALDGNEAMQVAHLRDAMRLRIRAARLRSASVIQRGEV